MRILDSEAIPIKLWIDDVENKAMTQILNLANLPFAFSHIAVMPDAHCGYGMPIGGVLATDQIIIPNAVGVDIGCGICAVRTSLLELAPDTLKLIMKDIRRKIPLGFKHHSKAQNESLMPRGYNISSMPVVRREYKSALHQIGTLGGGNHFIEIQRDYDGHIWLMIHTGSRNIGKQVADFYNTLAKEMNKKYSIKIPREYDLAFLRFNTEEGQQYYKEMNYCLEFAKANRYRMMDEIMMVIREHASCSFDNIINIHHNYAVEEKHFGKDVLIHRKGATSAREGQLGIIPGSQGSSSYIVKGKGNADSFCSCSHGAGRRMGRKQAQRELDLREETSKLDNKGILHSIRTIRDLDEAVSAYKDIDKVISLQQDLVDVVVKLEPMAVIKG